MRANSVKSILINILLLISIGVASIEYFNITIFGAVVTCCSFGSQCPEGIGRVPILKCCVPGPNEAPCSLDFPNYCRESCS